MEREPGDIRSSEPTHEVDAASNDAIPDWLGSMPPCPDIPSTDREIADSVARARREFDEGRGVPHELVSKWLATWGTPNEQPMPREWLE